MTVAVAIVERRAGAVQRKVPADWRPRFEVAYREELRDWVASIEAGVPSAAATSWDRYAATLAAGAALEAPRTGIPQQVTARERPGLYPAPAAGIARLAETVAPA